MEDMHSPTTDMFNSEDIVRDLAVDYAEYLTADTRKEREQHEVSVDEMLGKLEEFCNSVDMIRGDTTLCLNQTLPEIKGKAEEMEKIFVRIDQLEVFVATVKETISKYEEQIKIAEQESSSFKSIKKVFRSLPGFLTGKRTTSTDQRKGQQNLKLPDIFRTDDYLILKQTDKDSSDNGDHLADVLASPMLGQEQADEDPLE